jgi:hypothetical protein
VVKGGREIGGDLCHFFFSYGIGGILITGLKDVFERPTVLSRTSAAKKLNGERWSRYHEGDQDCSEVGHRLL